MPNITRKNPERSISPWRDFFDVDFFSPSLQSGRMSLPAVNLSENESSFNIEVVAPGFKKEDFKLKVNDDILTVAAETKHERTEGDGREYTRREYSSSSFTRSFRLPD